VNLSADISTNLTEGFQPFNLVPAGFSAQANESVMASVDYNQLITRDHTIQYSYIQAIQGWQCLVLPCSMSGMGVHIWMLYIALAMTLGPLHPFTVTMCAILDDWVSAEMELPSLLALVLNGPATCVFWMALQFHYYFHADKTQSLLGPPTVPCMTELTKQLHLQIFGQLAPVLLACYLLAEYQPPLPTKPFSPKTPEGMGGSCNNTWVLNPTPNPVFHMLEKMGWLGASILKQSVLTTAKGQSMCLSYHLCNACNSDCPCITDHRAHTLAKDTLLLAWTR